MLTVKEAARAARLACPGLAALPAQTKNDALLAVARELSRRKEQIFAANKEDMRLAREEGLPAPTVKRLKFDEAKLAEVIAGLESLAALPDPVGKTELSTLLDDGLRLYRVRCPIGVLGVIFESRPDALVQIASLALKSGNAVLLKGGREAEKTNQALFTYIRAASVRAGLPENWCHLLLTRQEVAEMLALDKDIQLVIPRGSNEFVRYIMENTNIPVLGHADGVCHTYVHENADLDMALRVLKDAKTQYVAVCNATETLLVHAQAAARLLPRLAEAMPEVSLYGCARTREIIPAQPMAEDGWNTEYLDYALSVKIVGSLPEAVAHINRYGSGHTDCIIAREEADAALFLEQVDSANVFWNCSTRFADGFRYGFGAEVGISTSHIHARGPVGLEGLTIYKYKLLGQGHIVAEYAQGKKYLHKPLHEDCPL